MKKFYVDFNCLIVEGKNAREVEKKVNKWLKEGYVPTINSIPKIEDSEDVAVTDTNEMIKVSELEA